MTWVVGTKVFTSGRINQYVPIKRVEIHILNHLSENRILVSTLLKYGEPVFELLRNEKVYIRVCVCVCVCVCLNIIELAISFCRIGQEP